MKEKNKKSNKKYKHYNDFHFKSVVQKRANGILKFVKIPYKINNIILSELTALGPKIHRMDFAGDAKKDEEETCLIIECQTYPPTEEDILRFFQYVSSLRVFKKKKVELYIICTKKTPYTKKEFKISNDCTYTMQMVSLKEFKAEEIFNNIENKLKNNVQVSDEDIASLQLIIYTDFTEPQVKILKKARKLIDRIAETQIIDINEKIAIQYLFDLLSSNMLNNEELEEYMEENKMILNPRERYFNQQGIEKGMEKGMENGRLEVAKNLLKTGMSLEEVIKITELPKNKILENIQVVE